MKRYFILPLLGFVLLVNSCKKDNKENIEDCKQTGIIAYSNQGLLVDTTVYIYNSHGKVIEEVFNGITDATYAYNGNVITKIDVDTFVYSINTEGYVEKLMRYADNEIDSIIYHYSTSGYLSNSETYRLFRDDGHITSENNTFTYSNGNLIDDGTTTYEYYTDKPYKKYYSGNEILTGKTPNNLLKSRNTSGMTFLYEYDLDNNGYVISVQSNIVGLTSGDYTEKYMLSCQ